MKKDPAKTARQGRPKVKETEIIKVEEMWNGDCKICNQSPCECVQPFSTEEKKKIIEVMSDDDFINFINQVGALYKSQQNPFIRSTEDDFEELSTEEIEEMKNQFNKKFGKQIHLSERLATFLSFSSKYWDPKSIKQLYFTIFAIKSTPS